MPKKVFQLPGDPRPLVVEWTGYWHDTLITLGGEPVGTVPERRWLRAGCKFELPDGAQLEVRLEYAWPPGVLVSRNGIPLAGSQDDPETQVKTARNVAWTMGGLGVVFGLLTQVVQIDFLTQMGMSWIGAIAGAILLVLGYFIGKRSRFALASAMTLSLADTALLIYGAVTIGARMPVGGVVMRLLFLGMMFPAFKAIARIADAEQVGARAADVF